MYVSQNSSNARELYLGCDGGEWSLYLWGSLIETEAGWAPEPVWPLWENKPCTFQESNLDSLTNTA